jgi:hypothetical protein
VADAIVTFIAAVEERGALLNGGVVAGRGKSAVNARVPQTPPPKPGRPR